MAWDELAKQLETEKGVPFDQTMRVIRSLAVAGYCVVSERHLIEITQQIDEHPEDYDSACACAECCTYA